MIAPIMPFITEEIYQTYYKKHEKMKSIHLSKWPKVTVFGLDGARWDTIFWDTFVDIVTKVRQEKTKAKKPMNSEIILHMPEINGTILREESGILKDLKNVTNAREIKTGKFKVEFK
jgi:valyl-tRNA synthetase